MYVCAVRRSNCAGGAGFFLTLLVCLLLAGCGGGSSGGGDGDSGGGALPGGDPGSGEITAEQRVASLEAVEDKFQAVVGQDPAAANQELLQFLQSRPEFEAAGQDVETLSVWARYRDGRLLVVPNNRLPEPGGGRRASGTASMSPAASRGRAFEMPSGNKVRLLHAFGTGFDDGQNAIDEVRPWLTANGYQDVPVQEGDARVSSLKNVRGDGIFWFNTHGAPATLRDGTEVFTLWTSTKVDADIEKLPEIADDLAKNRIVYSPGIIGTDNNGAPVVETHYAITPEFVRQYMSFEKNSLVLMTVCHSSNPKPATRAMVQAFHEKGAGVYVGWTKIINTSTGYRAAKIIVDWLLGANQYEVQNPPQRPFDLDSVLKYLKDKGLDVFPASGAQLMAERNPAVPATEAFGLLAPGISFVGADTFKDELVIQGQFGQDPGQDRSVTVNGTDVTIKSWTDQEIRCALPVSGPGSAGDVIVTARGHRSNARRLTEWRGEFRYSFTAPGSLLQTITFNIHLRLDINSLRGAPGTAPIQPQLLGTFAASDSRAGYEASGEATKTYDGCTTTLRWSGSGTLPLFVGGSTGPTYWGGQVLVNVAGNALSLQLEANSGPDMITESRNTVCESGSSSHQGANSLRIISRVFQDSNGMLNLTLDSGYNIVGGSRQTTVKFGGLPGGDVDAPVQLEWSRITAQFPPDPAAARSVRR